MPQTKQQKRKSSLERLQISRAHWLKSANGYTYKASIQEHGSRKIQADKAAKECVDKAARIYKTIVFTEAAIQRGGR